MSSTKKSSKGASGKKYSKPLRILRYIILFIAVVEILGRVQKLITGVMVRESLISLAFWLFTVAIIAVFEFKSNVAQVSKKK
jgi:hypothetical protein